MNVKDGAIILSWKFNEVQKLSAIGVFAVWHRQMRANSFSDFFEGATNEQTAITSTFSIHAARGH